MCLVVITYVVLWIYEGAVRKWIPGAATSFYVLRDVLLVAQVIFLVLSPARRVRTAPWFATLALPILVVTIGQVFSDSLPLDVAILGLRSYLSPLLFVSLVVVYGEARLLQPILKTVMIAIPVQLGVCVAQVLSPPQSVINAQVGSDAASFINFGVVRPSGTFSAPAGLATFVPVALSLALFCFASWSLRGRWVGLLGGMGCLLLTAISGSRGIVLNVTMVVVVYGIGSLFSWRRKSGLPFASIAALVIACGSVASLVFASVLDSFFLRFADASRSEDPLKRLIDQTIGFLEYPATLWGSGAGSRSQAGIAAGSGLQWLEVDSERWVAELGVIGIALAVVRIGSVLLLVGAIPRMIQRENWLFVLVAASFLPTLASGSLTQTPSAQAGGAVAVALLVLSTLEKSPLPPATANAQRAVQQVSSRR